MAAWQAAQRLLPASTQPATRHAATTEAQQPADWLLVRHQGQMAGIRKFVLASVLLSVLESSRIARGQASGVQRLTAEELGQQREGLWLSILGDIYDVTSGGRHYGRGATYNCLVGRDASRAFATGDFSSQGLTDNLVGLGDSALDEVLGWADFLAGKYVRIGIVAPGRFYSADGQPSQERQQVLKKVELYRRSTLFEEMRSKNIAHTNIDIWIGDGERIGVRSQPPPAAAAAAAARGATGQAIVRLDADLGGFARTVVAFRSQTQLVNISINTGQLVMAQQLSAQQDERHSMSLPQLQAFQQGYLYIHYHARHRGKQSRAVALPGYLPETVLKIPDGGIPAVAADQTQTILLQLAVPDKSVPGQYSGTVRIAGTVQSGAQFVRELPVVVQVKPRADRRHCDHRDSVPLSSSSGTHSNITGPHSDITGVVQRVVHAAPSLGEEGGLGRYLHTADDVQQQRWLDFLKLHNIPEVPYCSIATGSLFRWCL